MQIGRPVGDVERERKEGINYWNDTEIQRLTRAEHQKIRRGGVVHVRVSGERERGGGDDGREGGENTEGEVERVKAKRLAWRSREPPIKIGASGLRDAPADALRQIDG